MPQRKPSAAPGQHADDQLQSPRALTVLLVEGHAQDRELLSSAATQEGLTVVTASDLSQARRFLQQRPFDLLLLDDRAAGGHPGDFTREVRRSRRGIQTLVVSAGSDAHALLAAYRAGAADVMVRPLKAVEVRQRLRLAAARHRLRGRWRQRVQRLRRLCRKLEAARQEVSRQVDVLCRDLVTAYQEMAQQFHSLVQTSDFTGLVRDELDLEQALRKTLEYLLQKAGPTNAGIFLPVNHDEYSLGGYVNYDCTSDAPDALLQHLADVLAPAVAAGGRLVHVRDHAAMAKLLGEAAPFLDDYHLIAMPCVADGEVLAVITLFRHSDQPFTEATGALCEALGPRLAEYLLKLIRIHHRHLPPIDDQQPGSQAA